MPSVHAQIRVVKNLGNFQNIQIEFGADDDLKEDETHRMGMRRLYKDVQEMVSEALADTDGS